MEEQTKYIEALIELHRGLERKGPGDALFSEFILNRLPKFPQEYDIADIGCGSGAGTLLLAEKYKSKVRAVDFSKVFLDELAEKATQKGLGDLIEVIEGDMGSLSWDRGSIGLLWSEGAAYNITFEGALKAWRPFIAIGGVAVISEMNYFSNDVKGVVSEYMKSAYPGIKTEPMNIELIESSGFEFVETHRLPSEAWWKNYYNPLRNNLEKFKESADSVMRAVIRETEEEMKIFREHYAQFGYTFYIMRAIY
jgi:ubiquinone/menaquinone biosynthesis C-methylase UbiE